MRFINNIYLYCLTIAGSFISMVAHSQHTISDQLYIYPSGWGNTHIPYSTGDIYLTSYTGSGNGRFFFRTYDGSSYTERFRITADGKVGIKTTDPSHDLDVNGTIYCKKLYAGAFTMADGNNWDTNYHTHLLDRSFVYSGGSRKGFFFSAYGNGADIRFQTGNGWSDKPDKSLILSNSGNVGIGTITPSYKLSVNGTIGAKEVKVTSSGWSDFVFEPDYDLPTLQEAEDFIDNNGHLPDIPSAQEVEENGISLGEMDSKLLQKIEELTLYMIQLQDQVNELKAENAELKEKIEN